MKKYISFLSFQRFVAWLLIAGVFLGITPLPQSQFKSLNSLIAPKLAYAVDPWWNNSWTKRVKITFGNGSRGALTDFPVLVSLSSGRVTYGDFKASGDDIRFVDNDGTTVLNYEIEKWDTSGISTLWVKIPQIDSASSTDYVYMYYGNSGASATATTTGVWDSNYVTVQHWGEDPAGSAPQFQDSTVNNKDGTASSSQVGGVVVASTTAGKFGSGLDFNGNTQFVSQGETQLAPLANGSAEFWFDIDTVAASSTNRYLFSRVKSGSNDGELRVYVDTASGSVNRDKIVYQIECTVPSTISPIATSTASTTVDSWYHVTAVWDDDTAGAMKLYVNGSQVGYSNTTTCGSEATAVVTMQGKNNALNNGYFDGQMDELRVSNIARSADWINASYAAGQDTLNTYAAAESGGGPDVTAPVLSDIASTTSTTTAIITWNTDEVATSTINYGLTSSYGTASSSSVSTTSHSFTLTGLNTTTPYHFQISSWDSVGNLATSSDLVFTTGSPTPPGQPTNLLAYPYENRAYLTWTAATGTVTDYRIEYKLASEPTTWTIFNDATSTATSTMITGLTNGLAYNVRVTAFNDTSGGIVSASGTVTPAYIMAFVNPTIGQGNSTTSTTLIVAASSTTALTPSFYTFRLETSGGSLISNSTTTTRYGDYALNHLVELSHRANLSLTADTSGQVYVPTTDTLFTVHNNQNIITEINRAGGVVRTITCSSCGDIEDITLVSSVASSTVGGYDHTFMISTEDVDINNLQIFRVLIHSTGAVTVNRNDYFSTGLVASTTNDGLEGIAYNSNTDTYFVSVEGQATQTTRPRIHEVTLGSGHSTTQVPVCANLNFRDYLTEDNTVPYGNTAYADISGLDYVPSVNRLYVISHKADKIIEVDVSNRNSCTVLNQLPIAMRADSGANHDFEMPEGVSWDATGDYMYVSAEADYWSIWRTNTYSVQKTFSGLSTGNYNLYTSMTDTLGNTSTSSVRSFTVGADVTAPTITNVSSDKANGTYGVGEVVDIDVTFSEPVTSTGNVTVTLETGSVDRTCTFTVSNSTTGTCNYTVQSGDASGDLTTASISGTIADQSANSMSNFVPATNLAANKALVIDAAGPVISSVASTTSVTIATTTWTTDESSNSKLYYGTVTNTYTASTTNASLVTSHSLTVTGLTADTTYYAIVVSADAGGNTATSSEFTFKTTPVPDLIPPVISSIASSTTPYTATITWNTDELALPAVDYGLTSGYGTASSSGTLTLTPSITLTGLTPSTTYHFKVTSQDASGNSTSSTDKIFTTPADTTAPVISSLTTTTSLTSATITWVTNENASSSVSYGSSTADYTITATSSGHTTHSVTLTGLTEGTTYYYRVLARDIYTNVATTSEYTLTTTVTPVVSPIIGPQGGSSSGGGGNNAAAPQQQNNNQPQAQQPNTPAAVFKALRQQGVVIKAIQAPGKKKNNDIKNIQKILNADKDTQIAKKGPGSPGKETDLYGNATKAAVGKFQIKYKILKSPKDKGYGIVGPATKKKMNEVVGR